MGCGASATRKVSASDDTNAQAAGAGGTSAPSRNSQSRAGNGDNATTAPLAPEAKGSVHAYCGIPGASTGPPGYLGSDPHQAGWLAGKWTASPDDAERVDALRKLGILLTEREEAFDRLTQLGSQLMSTPICLISFVDDQEQWFKASVGLDEPGTGRDLAFCTYTTLRDMPGVFVVLNAKADIRFMNNPLVTGPPHIAFYAGAPIFHPDSDHKMGSFCVIDSKPHAAFDESQQRQLQMLADMVTHELVSRATRIAHENKARVLMTLSAEMRESQRSLEASIVNYRNLIESTNAPIFAVDNSQRLLVTLWNQRIAAFAGVPSEEAVGRPVVDVFQLGRGGEERQRRNLVRALLKVLDMQVSRPAAGTEAAAHTPAGSSVDTGPDGPDRGAVVEGTYTIVLDLAGAAVPGGGERAKALQLVMTPIVNDAGAVTGVVCVGESLNSRSTQAQVAAVDGAAAGPLAAASGGDAGATSAASAGVPRELRLPVDNIAGMLDAAMHERELREAKGARWLKRAHTSALLLRTLVADEYSVARTETRAVSLADEVFTPHEALDVTLAVVAHEAQRKGTRLLTQMEPRLREVFVRGDPHRVARTLVALAGFALQRAARVGDGDARVPGASGAGGRSEATVTLATHLKAPTRAGAAERFDPQPGDTVVLCFDVQDTGPALTPDAVATAFDAATEAAPGLAMAKALAVLMGGDLTARCGDDGAGLTASFSVLAEVARPADAAVETRATGPFSRIGTDGSDVIATEPEVSTAAAAAGMGSGVGVIRHVTEPVASRSGDARKEAQARGGGAHVLVCDDSEYNLDVARNMLEMLGHTVTTAHNGHVALETLVGLRDREAGPDGGKPVRLVLMDCEMPVMDGWAATTAIRQEEESRGWARVPVLAITAYASTETRQKCFDAGMDGYLTKPYSIASLRAKMAQHLKGTTGSKDNSNGDMTGGNGTAGAGAAGGNAAVVARVGGSGAGREASRAQAQQMAADTAPGDEAAVVSPASAASVPPPPAPRDARASAVDSEAAAVYAAVADKQTVNVEQMQAIFAGNMQLMSQAVSMFVTSSRAVPEQIEAALASKDFEKLHRTAHQCKGSSGYIGAERVQALSLQLQDAARELQRQKANAPDEAAATAVEAPLQVKAQVLALTWCLQELFAKLEEVQRADE